MKEYWLFNAARKNDYDNSNGSNATLGAHLDYVFGELGTPDFCNVIEAKSYQHMKNLVAEERVRTGQEYFVVDPEKERVVFTARNKEKDQTIDNSM